MRTDIRALAKRVASKGRKGDKTLVHMTAPEVRALRKMGATTNPDTGLPEAFSLGGLISGIGNSVKGAVKGLTGESNIVGNLLGLGGTGITGSTLGGNVARGKDTSDNLGNAATADIMGGAMFGLPHAGSAFASGGKGAMPPAVPESASTLKGWGLTETAPGVWEAGGSGAALGMSGAEAGAMSPETAAALGYGDAFGSEAAFNAGMPAANVPPMSPAIPEALPASGGAGAPGAPGTGAAGGGVVDGILKKMKDNALALGLVGGAALLGGKQTPPPEGSGQISREAQAMGKDLLNQYRSGQLSPSQQAAMDQMKQQAKNQVTQYFSSIGQANSTAHAQALAQVDQQALAMSNNILQTALAQGLQALGVASGPLNTMAQYQLGQDQRLSQAFGNFSNAVGQIFGQQSGKKA